MPRFLCLVCLLLMTARVLALEPMVVKYISSNVGIKEDYYLELVDTALKTTEATYGAYRIDYSEELLSTALRRELVLKGDKMNIDRIAGFNKKALLRGGVIKVSVPLLRGFMGYRIPLIRRSDQARFDAVTSVADLRKLALGLCIGWEGDIYQKDNFFVTETSNMMMLLEMLVARHIDFVPLGATEIENFYQVDNQPVNSLGPENRLLIYLPLPNYFYISPRYPELAKRLSAGLKQMEADGRLETIFDKYYAERLRNLHLSQRTIIEVPNFEDDGSYPKMDHTKLKNY